MKFELSIHAKKALTKRKIPIEWIEMVLYDPQKVENHKNDPDLKQYWKAIPEMDNRILHVVVNLQKKPVRIITAHFDRAMRGKL